MSKTQFWSGVAALYAAGLAATLYLASQHGAVARSASGVVTLLAIPLLWGVGPMVLAILWLALKRDLGAARFGLMVFAALYLVIVALRLHWGDLL